jgi:general secretion pathway protein J
VLVQALRSWQIYYHRDGAWSNALSSAGGSHAGSTSVTSTLGAISALPEGIRLVIELADNAPVSGKITLDWVRPTFTVAKQ